MQTKITLDDQTIDLNKGLSSEQVVYLRKQFGSNSLTPPPREHWLRQFLRKFDDPTIRILLVAAILSLGITLIEKYLLTQSASFIEPLGIIFAVLLATLAGFLCELKSAREFELLNKTKEEIFVKVLRNGQMTEILLNDIVVGDLVHLDLGDKVPADGVLLESHGLLFDQSLLTGESVPIEKKVLVSDGDYKKENIENTHLVFRGTMVNDGHGLFVVTRTGDQTELGKIAASLSLDAQSDSETPLTQKMTVLAKQISVVGSLGAMFIFLVMSVVAIGQSPLFTQLLRQPVLLLGLTAVSIVLGFFVMRLTLIPFFSGMGIEIRRLLLKITACIPLIVAVFALGLALSGIFDVLDLSSQANQSVSPATAESLNAGVSLLRSILLCFVIAVTIIVVAVPEGLPMMVAVSLAMNVMKMSRENCLVRKLVASETIGCATVICSDKTGTLTQNRMSPAWIFLGTKEYTPPNFAEMRQSAEWTRLVDSIAINTEAALSIEQNTIRGIGNPTECALLQLLHQNGLDYREYRDKAPRLWDLSHNSERKMSVVLVEGDQEQVYHIKGAPERLLDQCSGIYIDGQWESIEHYRQQIAETIKTASDHALRVIAFTEKRVVLTGDNTPLSDSATPDLSGQTFLALIGISDPIRPEVPHAIETCHKAGVEVKMITGDAVSTAVAIAKQTGILLDETDLILTSEELEKYDNDELVRIIPRLRVLARATPFDKLRLIKALHGNNEVVGMTGDGTNDAPALKNADVGISMGQSGTEVAKEASDIVLVDDNFKSIVTGILWGRTLYQNIQRFLQFQLSVNFVALFCALIGPLVGVPLPLTVVQLLWINIIMDTFAAIAYSTDPPRQRTMSRKPVPRDASIITSNMGRLVVLTGIYQVLILFAALYFGWFLADNVRFTFFCDVMYEKNKEALTVFFTIFIMFQFWHKFNCRSLAQNESPFELLWKNKLFLTIILVITFVQIVFVQASNHFGIGQMFRTVPLTLGQWLGITLLTATILPVAWLTRLWGQHPAKSSHN